MSLILRLFVSCLAWIVPAAAGAQQSGRPAYVGSNACTGCHEDAAAAWAGSHHALAWTLPGPDTVKGDFDDTTFEHDGFSAAFRIEDGRYFVTVTETDGGVADYPVHSLAGIAPIRLNSSFVSAPAERALTTIVNGAPRSAERLSQRLGDVQEGLYPCLARAAGASGKRTSLPLLAALFGRGSELDLVVLRETGRLGTADSDDPLGLRFVSNALRNPDPRYRAESVVALARLGCLWEIDGVIGALEDADRRVSQAALWALRHLSGNEWGAEASRWNSWWESERAWSEARL